VFTQVELRTTTPAESCTAFYEAVLTRPLEGIISALPEQARARGAPAHWLGHLHVAALEDAVERFVSAGAALLGPRRSAPDGAPIVGLRDPFGAVVALTSRPVPAAARASFTHLSRAPGEAEALYRSVAPSLPAATTHFLEIPPAKLAVGPREPGVHAQWVSSFGVEDLEAACRRVERAGGEVIVEGAFAYCHDPQRAVFGLVAAR
jgi:predicted enzyme related to lactoylglutathione lyase